MGTSDVAEVKAARLAREVSARVGQSVNAPQIQVMTRVARTRDSDALEFIDRFLALVQGSPAAPAVIAGLTEAIESVSRAQGRDPLAAVDDEMSDQEAVRVVALAEIEAGEARAGILAETKSAEESARLTRRSRQSLERLRREGRVLALREGKQWRYPRWQFEPDAEGGIVPGLAAVLEALRLSPAGAAYWLTRRHEALGATPIEALHRGRKDAVVELAQGVGERP